MVLHRRQVLLVLDSVDALFEDKGSEVCDRLVEFYNTLCTCGGQLRMLLTSEQSLLLETNKRFRNGTEKVCVTGRSWLVRSTGVTLSRARSLPGCDVNAAPNCR